MKNFKQLLEVVESRPMRKIAVAVAHCPLVLQGTRDALDRNIAASVLLGSEAKIRQIAEEHNIDLNGLEIVNEPDPIVAARRAVSMTSSGEAEILMKGHLHTDDFLRALLDRETGLRAGVVMSHVFVVEVPEQDKFLFVTDSAMNIAPDLEKKAEILLNAVHMANVLGVTDPRVAVLAAVELVNPKMQATVDATCLSKMSDRGQFEPHCTVDGPFALDNAISELAAKHKHITGPVAGKADIMVMPNIEAGNILIKALVHLAGLRCAGVLVGAKAPVVLTSRADSAETKLMSIAASVFMYDFRRALRLKIGKVHY